MTDMRLLGYGMALGICLMLIVPAFFPRPWDETDDATNGVRSGLTLYIDHGTGCEYIGGYASITPRLNAKGEHICK